MQDGDRSFSRVSITVWVYSPRHLLICFGIIQQIRDRLDNTLGVSADELNGASINCFRPLGVLSKNKDRFAEAWGLLLNHARDCEDEVGSSDEVGILTLTEE